MKIKIVRIPKYAKWYRRELEAFFERHKDLFLMLLKIEDDFEEQINEYVFDKTYNKTGKYSFITFVPFRVVNIDCERAFELDIHNLRIEEKILELCVAKKKDTLEIVISKVNIAELMDENLEMAINELKVKLPLMYL